MLNLQIERLRKLPPHADETWQAGLFHMPMWVEDDEGGLFRPWFALCIAPVTRRVGSAQPRVAPERAPGQVLDAVGSLATGQYGGYRPGRVAVRAADVAEALRPALAEIGIEVVEQPELPDLYEAYREMSRVSLEGEEDPAALVVKGVTIEHLRAFAEAARDFYQAAPWQHLSTDDLIEIVAPKPPTGLRFATVLGAGGHEYGMGFYDSRRRYERIYETADPHSVLTTGTPVWSFSYAPVMAMPFGDADAWEQHNLPVADEDAYPLLACYGSKQTIQRPTPRQWAFAEGLLRALAASTEAEMDTGRWSKTVETIDGPAEYTLSLPLLEEPPKDATRGWAAGPPDPRAMERMYTDMERAAQRAGVSSEKELEAFYRESFLNKPVPRQPGRTPLERAQDLIYEALATGGRRQLRFVRQALEVCPDCADAYVLLAERETDPQRAGELYTQGVAAGERALGPEVFTADAGHFWGILKTRPYMRARAGLAQYYEHTEQWDEAITHYQDMMRLNPNDNQGVRFALAACLLRKKDYAAVEKLLAPREEPAAHWHFLMALTAFAAGGDTPEARERAKAAHKFNRHVRKYLLGRAELPDVPPLGFHPREDDEAVCVVYDMLEDWHGVEGALAWFEQTTKSPPRKRPRRAKSGGRR
ncbi:MAG: hypothetical protein PVJ57_18990 [Phycisphaerae bacterium]|jgi:tetratricopeptide (TPR) repeat protein